MSAPIGPGDYVECVDGDRPSPGSWAADVGAYVISGKIYRVEGCGLCDSVKHGVGPGIVLDGPETKYPVAGFDGSIWSVRRFRPIYRPKQELIESLKKPAPEREHEPA